MTAVYPYISFPRNATEIFTFPAPRDAVAHGKLTGAFNLTGGDDLAGSGETLNRGDLPFVIEVDSVEEGERIIDTLVADGGKITMPFEHAPWGDHYGQCEDKYAMAWHVSTAR